MERDVLMDDGTSQVFPDELRQSSTQQGGKRGLKIGNDEVVVVVPSNSIASNRRGSDSSSGDGWTGERPGLHEMQMSTEVESRRRFDGRRV
jgi:hypothetical protein